MFSEHQSVKLRGNRDLRWSCRTIAVLCWDYEKSIPVSEFSVKMLSAILQLDSLDGKIKSEK